MPAERLPMRQLFELFRLAYDQGRSQREIARALGRSQSTVNDSLRRFRGSGLPWPVPPDVDEAAVEARLFVTATPAIRGRAVPDWATIHDELKRKGVTLQLLWIAYKRDAPDGYQYTQCCQHYRTRADTLEPALRHVHVAGEKTFVVDAELTMPVHDVATDTVREAQIFVGALGASHFLFAEPTWTQTLPDWIGSHVRMLE
jgi:transposase